jgi:hypothetical protein
MVEKPHDLANSRHSDALLFEFQATTAQFDYYDCAMVDVE